MKLIFVILFALGTALGIKSAVDRPGNEPPSEPYVYAQVINDYKQTVSVRLYFNNAFQKRIDVDWLASAHDSISVTKLGELFVQATVRFDGKHLDVLRLPGTRPGERYLFTITHEGIIAWSSQ